jgi:hypothetical protein
VTRLWITVSTHVGVGAALALVAFLYLPTLDDPFHGDDFVAFKDFGTRSGFEYLRDVFLFRDSNFYWRPLGCAFHFLLYELWGFDPVAFRLAGLVVFLLTLVALYVFCLRERLGIAVSLGAVLIFGLLPNHVVSVAWVTNTSRLMAVLFVLLGLVLLQMRDRKAWHEGLAWLAFMAGVLSDETALALAPAPFLYATFLAADRIHWRSDALRLIAYTLPVLLLLPLQFENTLNDEPRLASYEFGPHIITQTWALVSQLILPITPTTPIDVRLYEIGPAQWAAGLIGIVLGGALFLFGSGRMRFLVVWLALSLSPFALWGVNYTSPRYVYMAALPYAIILSWVIVSLVSLVHLRPVVVRRAAMGLAAGAVAAAAFVSSVTVMGRNDAWSAQAFSYGLLVDDLRETLPTVPANSRIVIYYSPWPDFWATSVVQSIYEDPSIRVVNVRRSRVESGQPVRRPNDVVLYYTGDKFISLAPPGERTQAQ